MALCPWLPRWASTRKVKPIWILLKQETASVGGISWAICKPAPRSRQITTSAPHHSVFYRLGALPVAQQKASKHWRQNWQTDYFCYFLEYNFLSDSLVSYEYTFACLFMHVSGWRCSLTGLPLTSTPLRQKKEPVFFCVRLFFSFVLFFSRPWSEGWPHHGRTFSIYPCPLSFWLTLPQRVLCLLVLDRNWWIFFTYIKPKACRSISCNSVYLILACDKSDTKHFMFTSEVMKLMITG